MTRTGANMKFYATILLRGQALKWTLIGCTSWTQVYDKRLRGSIALHDSTGISVVGKRTLLRRHNVSAELWAASFIAGADYTSRVLADHFADIAKFSLAPAWSEPPQDAEAHSIMPTA